MKSVGEVTHYYGKIGVAIVELSSPLKVGDAIKIVSQKSEAEQPVDSMEVDHQSVSEARKGDVVGLKVREKTSEGAKVYHVEG